MSFERQKRLVERLLEKSRAGQISWEETPEDDVFQISFSKNKLNITNVGSGSFPQYQIRIVDEYDVATEYFYDIMLDNDEALSTSKWKNAMRELHNLARRKAMKADEVLDSILSEIG